MPAGLQRDARADLERPRVGLGDDVERLHLQFCPYFCGYDLPPLPARMLVCRAMTTTATPTVLIDQDELSARIVALAQEIRADFPTGQLHFICVLKGAFLFLGDLIRSLDGHVTIDFMACSSYGAATSSSGEVRLLEGPRRQHRGPRRHHRRGHRRYRADAALPAGDSPRPRPAVAAHRVPAEQALPPQDRRQGRLHRLHDRGQVRRRLRPRLRRAISQPALHRRARVTSIGRTLKALPLLARPSARGPRPCGPR